MAAEVVETVLSNGLKVLTRELHGVPVASFWAWYRVGSRNEPPGLTGASHLVEHMLFRPGKPGAGGDVFRTVARVGGTNNAFTSNDFTCYFETLPTSELDLALRIERRRLEAPIDGGELAAERTVVLSEKQGAENNPHTLLTEAIEAKAFRRHPYRHPVIGTRDDLAKMTAAQVRGYFRRHYTPDRMVLVAAGDFSTDRLLRRIELGWGGLRRGRPAAPVPAEPTQRAERRVEVRRPGGAAYIEMLYKGPPASHADACPLMVASTVLAGSRSFVGGSPTGILTSRLYKSLVQGGLASAIHSFLHPTVDPFGLSVGATALKAEDRDRLEQALLREIDRLASQPLPEEDLRRAITQLRASHAYSIESITHIALLLGYTEMVADYTLFYEHPERLAAVTARDVQRAVQRYMSAAGRTVGWFIPTAPSSAPEEAVEAPTVFAFTGVSDATRLTTRNAATVLVAGNPAAGSVVIRGSMPGGPAYDPEEQAGLSAMTASTATRGTARRSHEEIFRTIDSVGAALAVSPGLHNIDFSVKCLTEHWPMLFELLIEILAEPSFPPGQVDLVRSLLMSYLEQVQDSPRDVADLELHHLIYPAGHPYHHYPFGYAHTVKALTRDDLVRFHRRMFAPEGSIFCLVGNVDPERTAEQMARLVERWRRKRRAPVELDLAVAPLDAPRRKNVTMKEKPQAEIALGFKAPPRLHPDFFAMDQLTQIVGGLGLMGRLGHNIREKQGLAYYAHASYIPAIGEYAWSIRAGVHPDNIDRAVDAILDELRRIREHKPAAGELRDTKGYLVGSIPLKLETNEGRAAILRHIEFYGLGRDYVERYPELVNAVTAEDVQAAARKHIAVDGYALVVTRP